MTIPTDGRSGICDVDVNKSRTTGVRTPKSTVVPVGALLAQVPEVGCPVPRPTAIDVARPVAGRPGRVGDTVDNILCQIPLLWVDIQNSSNVKNRKSPSRK